MIVFASCVGVDGGKFRTVGAPAIKRVAHPDDLVWTQPGVDGICAVYNGFLDRARSLPGLDAVVLMHDDVELIDPEFRDKVLRAATEPGVGIIGVVGGRGLASLSWWDARHLAGRVRETRGVVDFGPRDADVDVVDGLMLILTPAAIAGVCFDRDKFPAYHGYDVDICLQARAAGFRVVVRDIDVFHSTKGGFGNKDAFSVADNALMSKWQGEFLRPLSVAERIRYQGRRVTRRIIGQERQFR